jgi:hypothetical protein
MPNAAPQLNRDHWDKMLRRMPRGYERIPRRHIPNQPILELVYDTIFEVGFFVLVERRLRDVKETFLLSKNRTLLCYRLSLGRRLRSSNT